MSSMEPGRQKGLRQSGVEAACDGLSLTFQKDFVRLCVLKT